jgi:hypothetical protein
MSISPGAGGARMSLGHNFQRSVTTWALSHMLLQTQGRWQQYFDLENYAIIERVSCETNDLVDDICLEFSGKRVIYGQCKTSVSLSKDVEKELGAAITQFYHQFAKNRSEQIEYRLVLFCEKPSASVKKLSNILNRYRFFPNDALFHEAAYGEHKTIVDTFNDLLTSLEARPEIATLNVDRQGLLRLMYIFEIHREGLQSYLYDTIKNLQSQQFNPNDAERTLSELTILAGELMEKRGMRDRLALLRHLEQLSFPIRLIDGNEHKYTTLRENYICHFDSNLENNSNIIERESIFEAIDAFFSSRQSGYFCIEAGVGLGKTSLATTIIRQYDALHFFASTQQNFTRASDCLRHLCASVIIRFQLPYYDLPDRAGENHDYLNKLLKEATAKKLSTMPMQLEPLCIVVDALDEFDSPRLGRPILPLPECLPEGVFFVLTYRPGTTPPQIGKIDVEHYSIEDHFQDHLNTIRSYLLYKASTSEIQQALMQMKHPMSMVEFVSQLEEVSEGNFMYLRYVLDDLVDHKKSHKLLDLRSLPKGLQAYYEHLWGQMQPLEIEVKAEEWEYAYLPVITLLTAAREPVSLQWLVDHSGVKPKSIHHVLQRWQRFLRTNDLDNNKTWYLIHQSFAEFLEQHEYLPGNHQAIAHYYLSNQGRWNEHSGYPHRHLSMHLHLAGQYDKLFTLIDNNSWKQSQLNADASGTHHLNDIAHAWSIAELANSEAFQHHRKLPLLNRELCCAIAASEVHSTTRNIPPELLKALVHEGIWEYSQAFEIVRQIPDPEYACKAFIAITSCIQRISSYEELEFAISLPEQVGDETLCPRGSALIALAQYLPEEQLIRSLDASISIRYVRGQYTTLIGLSPYLSYEMLMHLQEFSCNTEKATEKDEEFLFYMKPTIDNSEQNPEPFSWLALLDGFQNDLVIAISIRLAQLGYHGEAITNIQKLRDSYSQKKAIKNLASYLPNYLQEELINLTAHLTKASDRGEALLGLVEHLPDQLLPIVLGLLRDVTLEKYPHWQVEALATLISRIPSHLLADTLEIIQKADDASHMEEAYIALFSRMAQFGLFDEALQIARSLIDSSGKALALRALDIGELDLRHEEFEALISYPHQWRDAPVLGYLAKQWSPALICRAFYAIIAIKDEYERARFLMELAPFLKGDLASKALAVALKIDNFDLVSVLAKLIPQLGIATERKIAIKQVLQYLEHIKSGKLQLLSLDLVKLASCLTDDESVLILRATFASFKTMEDYYQAQEIKRIVHLIPHYFLYEALEAIKTISTYWHRKSVVEAAVPHLPSKDLLLKALEIVNEFDDLEEQSNLQLTLAAFLVEKHCFRDAITSIASIKVDKYILESLRLLSPKIPISYQEQLLHIAFSINQRDLQVDAFRTLIPVLPEDLLSTLIVTVPNIKGTNEQRMVANALIERLTQSWLIEAAHQWRTISDHLVRLEVFTQIIHRLQTSKITHLLDVALEASHSIDRSSFPASATHQIVALQDLLPYFPEAKQLDILNDIREATYDIYHPPAYHARALVRLIALGLKLKHVPIVAEAKKALFLMEEEDRLRAFIQIAGCETLPQEERFQMLQQALEIVESREVYYLNVYQLPLIIQLVPINEQLPFFQKALSHISISRYPNDLQNINTLVECLAEEVRKSARYELAQFIQRGPNLGERIYSLTLILSILSVSERKSIIQDIWNTNPAFNEEDDPKAIEDLLGCLSPSERCLALQAGIDAAHRCEDKFKQAYMLITLTALLPQEEWENTLPDIILAMSKIGDPANCTKIIIATIPLLETIKSRLLTRKVFSIAEKIESPQERWKALLLLSVCETDENRQNIMLQVINESRDLRAEQRFQVFLPVMDKISLKEKVSILIQ